MITTNSSVLSLFVLLDVFSTVICVDAYTLLLSCSDLLPCSAATVKVYIF